MSLRIIGGHYKGIPLHSPKGDQTRPTSSLLRKSVFDTCQSFIEDAQFLDLFAGSGAMGLEALSRGAAHATFVEQHKLAAQCIKSNIEKLHASSLTTLLILDVHQALTKLEKEAKTFDIIYADPPYKLGTQPFLFTLLDASSLLHPGSILFFEEGHNLTPSPHPHFIYEDKRHFGTSYLHRFKKL